TPSESTVEAEIGEIFNKSEGRIIYACYASGINAIQRLLNVCTKTNRKISIFGRALLDAFNNAVKMGYLKTGDNEIVNYDDLSKYKDEEIVILMSGKQGEPLEALQKMAKQS